MTMNLTMPHDLINAGVGSASLDDALKPILEHFDPDNKQDLGGHASFYFSDIDWNKRDAEQRGYVLLRFCEFIINTFREIK